MPKTDLERRRLLAWADALSNAAAAVGILGPMILPEKYGAYVECTLANPLIQDQLLCNGERWRSLIELGHACIANASGRHAGLTLQALADSGSAGLLPMAAHLEASRFLTDFAAAEATCAEHVRSLFAISDVPPRVAKIDSEASPMPVADTYLRCVRAQETMQRLQVAAAPLK